MNKIPFTISENIFNDAYLPTLNNNHRYQIYYGGAGSGKSVFVGQKTLTKFFEGGHNYLIVRQTAKSNRHSTFALLQQLFDAWKIPDEWFKINKTEMTITNTVNKSMIVFAGLDNVQKLKSITFKSGILTDIWIEEASETREKDFNDLNLRLRGIAKVPFCIYLTFNPIDAKHWIKKRFFDNPTDNSHILKTTYLDNKFINKEYINALEELKEADPVYYNVYALGEWGVLGNTIYSNYVIEDFDTTKFTEYSLGLDFGFNNPSACLKMALYDNEIYVCDEIYATNLTNSDLINLVKEKFGTGIRSIADSAEQDRIEEFRRAGFYIEGCKKGADSVKAGIDYLRRMKIHIHKSNCPETAKEISTYKYREDRQGNVLDEPVKFKDHAMDGMRYGSEIWRNEDNRDITIETFDYYSY